MRITEINVKDYSIKHAAVFLAEYRAKDHITGSTFENQVLFIRKHHDSDTVEIVLSNDSRKSVSVTEFLNGTLNEFTIRQYITG